MEKLKVSVIGTGHLGTIHARLWRQNDLAELVGIYDTNPDQVKKVTDETGCQGFASLEEAIAASEAVTIAVPTSLHYEVACKCVDAGVHALIEKPITDTSAEAQKLISKAKEKNVLLQVGHVERFNPALAALKSYKIAPRFVEAHRLSQFKPRAIDVSVVLDLMIHDIDILLWLIKSEVEKIDANGVALLTDTPDIANARLTFKNGAVANITASRISANPMRKMRIFQPNSYMSIDFGKPDVEVFNLLDEKDAANMPGAVPATMLGTIDAGTRNKLISFEKPPVPKINAIAEEQTAFVNAIRGQSKIAVSADEAAEALRIAELVSKQIY